MAEFVDKNLILFFSWGRREYVEKCFPAVLKNKREQDRLLVVDQGLHNLDYYLQFKDQIDFFFLPKLNYFIGPVWDYLRHLTEWLIDTSKLDERNNIGWYPDYVNIIESDALVKDGWIDKLMPLFQRDGVKVASGYLGLNDPNSDITQRYGDVYFKTGTQGVNIIMRAEDYLKIKGYPKVTQDAYFSTQFTGAVACMDLVEHIGTIRRKAGFFK